ncbi:MAG: Hsp20 family protein [Clostridia bacterium]|nr:Hsp20 family protein [Clostridia bacterium]
MKNYLTTREGSSPFGLFGELESFFSPFRTEDVHVLATDVKEYPTYYLLEVEIPGMVKGNADISYENGYLTVAATKTDENDGTLGKWRYIKRERTVGATRRFYVGDVNDADIKATYNDGVLYVSVPKTERGGETVKKIQIHHPGDPIKD